MAASKGKKTVNKKAGVVPYTITEADGIKMMFMRSQKNPDIGWQIAKGGIEKNESNRECAFREAREELGLFEPMCGNIEGVGNFGGISLYIAEVLSTSQFGDPDASEVCDITWLSLDEFVDTGRMSQQHIVKQVYKRILDANPITKEKTITKT